IALLAAKRLRHERGALGLGHLRFSSLVVAWTKIVRTMSAARFATVREGSGGQLQHAAQCVECFASYIARSVIRLDGSIKDAKVPGTVIDAMPMKVATEAKRPTSAKLAITAALFTRARTRSPSVVPSWISTS